MLPTYFRLSEEPFGVTVDPGFLFLPTALPEHLSNSVDPRAGSTAGQAARHE
jgi:hypothetical protein